MNRRGAPQYVCRGEHRAQGEPQGRHFQDGRGFQVVVWWVRSELGFFSEPGSPESGRVTSFFFFSVRATSYHLITCLSLLIHELPLAQTATAAKEMPLAQTAKAAEEMPLAQ